MASRSESSSSFTKNTMNEWRTGVKPNQVQVFLRIRGESEQGPNANTTQRKSDDNIVCKLDATSVCLEPPPPSNLSRVGLSNTRQKFLFTHVFTQTSTQQEVFQTAALGLAQNLVSGESGLLFNYGVTNSGKTYTMQGSPTDPGLVPRTLDVVFQLLKDKLAVDIKYQPHLGGLSVASKQDLNRMATAKDKLMKLAHDRSGKGNITDLLSNSIMPLSNSIMPLSSTMLDNTKTTCAASLSSNSMNVTDISDTNSADLCPTRGFTVWISFVEIYNEYIYDLFAIITNRKRVALLPASNKEDELYIRGVSEIQVSSADEAYRLFIAGQKNLHHAATKLNYNSSRSHCCFYVKLVSFDGSTASQSVLTLCDLAGSERNSKTDSVGDRLYESGKINSSLMVLGRCMELLRSNQSGTIVPYRDSKLTHLFKGFLTGKGKIVSIVNIGLQVETYDETLHALKFSAVASQVEIMPSYEFLKVTTKNSRKDIRSLRRTLSNIANCTALSIPWEDEAMRPSSEFSHRSDDDDDWEDDEDDGYEEASGQNHIVIINCLKGLLHKAIQEKDAIEIEVRNELCDMHDAEVKRLREYYNNRLDVAAERHNRYENERRNLLDGLHQAKKRALDQEHSSQIEELNVLIEELTVEKEIAMGEMISLRESMAKSQTAHTNLQQKYTNLQMEVAQVQQLFQDEICPKRSAKSRVSFVFGPRTPFKEILNRQTSALSSRKTLDAPVKSDTSINFKDIGKFVKEYFQSSKENVESLLNENMVLKQKLSAISANRRKSGKPDLTMDATAYYSFLNTGSSSSSSGAAGYNTSDGSSTERICGLANCVPNHGTPPKDSRLIRGLASAIPTPLGQSRAALNADSPSVHSGVVRRITDTIKSGRRVPVTEEVDVFVNKDVDVSEGGTPRNAVGFPELVMVKDETESPESSPVSQNTVSPVEASNHESPMTDGSPITDVMEATGVLYETESEVEEEEEEEIQDSNAEVVVESPVTMRSVALAETQTEAEDDHLPRLTVEMNDLQLEVARQAEEIVRLETAMMVLIGEKAELVQELDFASQKLESLNGRLLRERGQMDEGSQMLRVNVQQLESKILDLSKSLSDQELELITTQRDNKTLLEKVATTIADFNRVEIELSEALASQRKHLKTIDQLKRETAVLKERIASLKAEQSLDEPLKDLVESLQADKTKLEQMCADSDDRIAMLEAYKARQDEALAEMQESIRHATGLLEEVEEQKTSLQVALQEANDSLIATKQGSKESEVRLKVAETNNGTLKMSLNRANDLLASTKSELTLVKSRRAQRKEIFVEEVDSDALEFIAPMPISQSGTRPKTRIQNLRRGKGKKESDDECVGVSGPAVKSSSKAERKVESSEEDYGSAVDTPAPAPASSESRQKKRHLKSKKDDHVLGSSPTTDAQPERRVTTRSSRRARKET